MADNSKNNSKIVSQGNLMKSRALRFFLSYDAFEKKFFESLIYKAFSVISGKFSRVKSAVSASCERSSTARFTDLIIRKLLEVNLRYYGVALFFFSVFLSAFSLVREISTYGTFSVSLGNGLNSVLVGVVSLFISVIMMTSQKCIASLLCESPIFSYFLFRVFCFDAVKIQKIKPVQRSHTLPVIIGMVCAVICALITPIALLKVLLFLLLAATIFRIPENGVIFVFLALPFFYDGLLFTSVGLVCLSYIFKLLRSKRVYKTGLFDVSVFLFMMIVLISGIISVNYVGSFFNSLITLAFLVFGFVISNTMKTSRLIEKCISALTVSASIIAFIGIIDFVFGYFNLFSESLIFKTVSDTLNLIPFSDKSIYGELVALIVPLAFIKIRLSEKASEKTSAFVCFAIILLFSVISFDVSVWFSALFSIVIFALFLKPKLSIGAVCSAIALFLAYVIFPLPFEGLKGWILGYASSSQSASLTSVFEMLGRFDFLGMGTGADSFKYVSGCMFGFGDSGMYVLPNSFFSFLLKYGVLGVISFVLMSLIYLIHCISFCCSETGFNPKMKLYASGCAACVISIILKAFFFNIILSYEVLLCLIMIVFISISAKRCALIEYVPDKKEYSLTDEGITQ